MPEVTLQIAKTPDRIDFMSKTAQMHIQNKIGLRKIAVLNAKDIEAVTQAMAKSKKPADYTIDFDGMWFTYAVKTGTFKKVMNEINIIEDGSSTDKAKIVENLVVLGAATKKQVDALKERSLI